MRCKLTSFYYNKLLLLLGFPPKPLLICLFIYSLLPEGAGALLGLYISSLMMVQAISYYNKASRVLGDRKLYPDIWDSVNWELSSALFTLGTLLQDYAPLSTHSQEEIEKEVVKLMLKSLDLCSSETSLSRQPLYQYRAATIYHRLASLHHNAYRNQVRNEASF
ncbi:unnamed protein product [Ixodes persulcatus]